MKTKQLLASETNAVFGKKPDTVSVTADQSVSESADILRLVIKCI